MISDRAIFLIGIYFTYFLTVCVLVIGLFYAVPDKYILDYRSIVVKFSCDNPLELKASSVRYPQITTTGRGEDNIYIYRAEFDSYKDAGLPVDRITWDDATYRVGTTNDAWPVTLHQTLSPGQYVLVGEPIIKWIIFERSIDPIQSDPFTIHLCE